MCVLICPHTTIFVSSYCYICVLVLLYMCLHITMCPHTFMYVSSGHFACQLPEGATCGQELQVQVPRCVYVCVCVCVHQELYVFVYVCVCVRRS
jgi:hypothetical protein